MTFAKLKIGNTLALAIALAAMVNAAAQAADLATLQKLPLFDMANLEYVGGFRLPTNTYGVSDVTYAEGPIALGANGASLFIVGNAQKQAIGEFSIPALIKSADVAAMNTAVNVQAFTQLFNRPASGNPQALDTVGGMAYIDGHLVVNTFQYYDAANAASNTTLVVKGANNLGSSAVAGYHSLAGRAHASGWLSPIPADWQAALGGTYITGSSSGKPIISRLSVGPSAFAFDPTAPDISAIAPSTLPTTTLLDYNLDHPMGAGTQDISAYLYNSNLKNQLWNHLSHAAYGFIIPGTRTYMAIGSTGGIASGIGYKITQDNGNLCGGHCPYKVADNYNYYWLFDLNDLVKVKAGQIKPYTVVPYAYGKFDKAFAGNGFNAIIGGAYDSSKGLLYLSTQGGDRFTYGWAPLIVTFKVKAPTAAAVPSPLISPPAAPINIIVQPVVSK